MANVKIFIASLLIFSFVLVDQWNTVEAGKDNQYEFYEKILTLSEKIERSPRLKAEWNRRVRRDRAIDIPPPEFYCDVTNFRSKVKPTSVHQLRPGDIDVIAGFGDSISAGNGLGAPSLLAVALENRGEVFSIGGDATLEEGVVTLPNIMRKFNTQLKGYSLCKNIVGLEESNEAPHKMWYNVARPGGKSDDLLSEAEDLVERMRFDPRVNMEEDWKLLTLFVGGNDLCASCRRNHSAEWWYGHFEDTLLYLSANLDRTFVNLVSMFDVAPLGNLSTGILCDLLQWGFCDCARNSSTIPYIRSLQQQYHFELEKLANDPRFKRDDFTVVLQPHMRDMVPPWDPNGDGYLEDFLSPDCFHPNRIAHQAFALYLWNTMLIPVGQKPCGFDSQQFYINITCPTEENPYIFTDMNSVDAKKPNAAMQTVVKVADSPE